MLDLHYIPYRKPQRFDLFIDHSDHWRLFREARFALAGDGEYVVLRGLDLSGLSLFDFPNNFLAFVQCRLDSVRFESSEPMVGSIFVDCSMKDTDFALTTATSLLFYRCDLFRARFRRPDGSAWATANQDGQPTPTLFFQCEVEEESQRWLRYDGSIFVRGLRDGTSKDYSEMSRKLHEVVTAPLLEV